MKTAGLVGFSYKDWFVANSIRYIRNSQFSHCFVCLGDLQGIEIVGEAGTLEVDMVPLSQVLIKEQEVELWRVEVDTEVLTESLQKIMKLTGNTYGHLQLVGFVWPWLCSKVGITTGNPFEGGIVCSEYVWHYLKGIGHPDFTSLPDANNTAPDHIRKMLQRDGSSTIAGISRMGQSGVTWIQQ